MIVNAAGRKLPETIGGQKVEPFMGAFATPPRKKRLAPKLSYVKPGEDKLMSLDEAVMKYVKDGMTISFHHHLRDGDYLVNQVLEMVSTLGIKDVVLASTALFPVHEPVVRHLMDGTVRRVEGSMNGPVGRACSFGHMKEIATLRDHGGRGAAVEMGDLPIDVAFIAAPTADDYGNCNGVHGKSACGPLGYSYPDSLYAKKVIAVTDNLVEYPVTPMSIHQTHVDHVAEVETIGNPEQIVSGTTKVTKSPTNLQIAEYVVETMDALGIISEGASIQAGAGGISLSVTSQMGDLLEDRHIVGGFGLGGVTQYLVDMLHRGVIKKILDAQCFDLTAVQSLRDDPDHAEINIIYSSPYNKGSVYNKLDAAFLGATEVDLDFNVNVNTHSDGLLLHGIGGHQGPAACAKVTFITVPLYRKRIPVIRDRVTTISTPGEVIDVIATEYGIAVNPRRKDILKKVENTKIPVLTIEELKKEAYDLCGEPELPDTTDDIVAVIQWRDGTILDTVKKVVEK
ncbi:MAG: citrate lyase subunit alpha [Theionarchaea archaeon]|nr:citrate lyase subunit alpha [Theionarchaea archaeon]MBU6999143.1 citrate lyase subunit alpha [Theionarchaea archaeon]MBU7019504.1 citrate lyase subunit alpha [Theionarchaea archaeon]MBU7034936.1 citrate lyase subunit alpha [Theionarchaea archaeon]MBU7040782.1 citrate lyase subunit alpha [Theionarchaea archaeon]